MYSYDEYTMLRLRLGRWADPEDAAPIHKTIRPPLVILPRLPQLIAKRRGKALGKISLADP